MRILRIRGWRKWQSYRKDRGTPPWIKIYRCLMTNPDWARLSDAEKGQLVSIWIVGADKDGIVPDDPDILRKVCILDKAPDINLLIGSGFLCHDDVTMASVGRQDDTPETETETETKEEKNKHSVDSVPFETQFEAIWEKYPRKIDKKKCLKKYIKARKNNFTQEQFLKAIENYVNYTYRIRETEFKELSWKYAVTWLNQFEEWIDPECDSTPVKQLSVSELEVSV